MILLASHYYFKNDSLWAAVKLKEVYKCIFQISIITIIRISFHIVLFALQN